jgi:F0F1-type ATP synthase membrane subunit b/b'
LDTKVAEIRAEAEAEALAEGERIQRATHVEVLKLRAQGEKEISNILKSAQLDVRRFVAAEGIKQAEALIRRDLGAREDATLIAISADELGGNQR